ncbi:histone acetyltransferase KAT6A-like protein [Leptotrombidium deliense]|uniref:Histone acetyltransferase KAT6A-like protein n=1 Tax=Leptotrombidium deliense TaxID=299467 RepID=A0A443S8A9_9ACAR|nr:histone acetyltransferase KAT6A-like protein [Leptotrombidium deliense]
MTDNKQPKLDYALLIEAIEALKARKARPDKTRICHHLERKRALLREDVLDALSAAVNDGVILKVRYKDYYSYRIPVPAANNAHTVNDTEHTGRSSPTADVRLILKTVADELKSGVSEKQLENILRTEDSFKILKNGKFMLIEDSTKRNASVKKQGESYSSEDDDNGVIRVNIGNNSSTKKKKLDKDSEAYEPQNNKNETRVAQKVVHRGRPISQRKKIRKSLGPDFLDPSALGLQYLHDVYEPKCRYCHLSTKGEEKILSCIKCGYNAHVSCFTVENKLKYLRNGEWLCASCKSQCGLCSKKISNDSVMSCNNCGNGFHYHCVQMSHSVEALNPKSSCTVNLITNINFGFYVVWMCKQCSVDDSLSMESGDSMQIDENQSPKSFVSVADDLNLPHFNEQKLMTNSGRDTKSIVRKFPTDAQRVINSERKFENGNEMFDKDPINWSVNEVANFIRDIGFPEQARYFREQEIDGRSLLLMKRVDVLTGLPIKLGPALKIYAHIFKLQGTKMSIINPFSNDSYEKMEKRKCSATISMQLTSPALISQV